MRNYLYEMRPKHWVKNILIFAAPVFAGAVPDGKNILPYIYLFVAFCFASSAIYILNDIFDRNADRQNPRKQGRPVASGKIKVSHAAFFCLFLAFLSILLMIHLPQKSVLSIAAYIGLNSLYSAKLKHIPVIDIMALSVFYLLRIYAGAGIDNIYVSEYLTLTVFCGAMYCGAGKRLKEMDTKGGRRVLSLYNKEFLSNTMTMFEGLTFATYAIWVLTYNGPLDPKMLFISIFILMAAVLEYHLLVTGGTEGNPVNVFFSDRTLAATCAVYCTSIMAAYMQKS